MLDDEIAFAGVAGQAELIRRGDVSVRELVELLLGRIERLEPELNTFGAVFAERALLEADQADARARAGERRPLLGIPVAVKDEIDIAGEITSYGTGAMVSKAPADAEVVRRLRAAGAIVIGKTKMPEFGLWPFTESATWGVTRNPWDPERTPGGSSGGSAAAVAAGMVPAALARRWRRLDPDPRRLLRAVRNQAATRSGPAGSPLPRQPLDRVRGAHALGPGRRPDARRSRQQ